MTTNTILDFTPTDPSLTAGETEMLLFALERSRMQFAWKCGGLDADALRRPHAPSTMTLGGLIKHIALIEDIYTARITGEAPGEPWAGHLDGDWEWASAADDSADELYALWRDAVHRSRETWTAALADGGLDAPWRANVGEWLPNRRRGLVDLHDEYARHLGHADLLREAVDGLVGEDPPR